MSYLKLALLVVLFSPQAVAQKRVDVGLFSQQDLQGWKQKKFLGETSYSLKTIDTQSVLSAHSQQSASAFYKKIRIDLEQTPVLHWSWSKQLSINPDSESEKSGDDFVARIYVIKDGGLFFWKTLVINYVWSQQHRKNEIWDNPFAGSNAKMLSQQDMSSPDKKWFYEKRNVKQDFEVIHGKKISTIDGIAIMTDSDNTGQSAKAYYGDIFFTAE